MGTGGLLKSLKQIGGRLTSGFGNTSPLSPVASSPYDHDIGRLPVVNPLLELCIYSARLMRDRSEIDPCLRFLVAIGPTSVYLLILC